MNFTLTTYDLTPDLAFEMIASMNGLKSLWVCIIWHDNRCHSDLARRYQLKRISNCSAWKLIKGLEKFEEFHLTIIGVADGGKAVEEKVLRVLCRNNKQLMRE